MIDRAYREGETLGLAVWTKDEAGPYQTKPRAGTSWQPMGQPARQPHEYVREGTAKLMTLFRPATGEVRVKGVPGTPNKVLHPWLQQKIEDVLKGVPSVSDLTSGCIGNKVCTCALPRQSISPAADAVDHG